MYPNLDAELARLKVKTEQLADVIGKTVGTTRLKLNGDYYFTLDEAKAVRDHLAVLGRYVPLDELFSTEA